VGVDMVHVERMYKMKRWCNIFKQKFGF
jgi:hypothetical protein